MGHHSKFQVNFLKKPSIFVKAVL